MSIPQRSISGEEALKGLELIRVKYAPDVIHEEQLAKCGKRVTMYRLNIELMTGKEAIELVKK